MIGTVQAARITSAGTDPVISDSPVPRITQGHVLVRMHAAALNFADLLQAAGQYQEHREPPFTPGLEGAGEVIEAWPDSGFSVGDRVAVCMPGTLAQVIAAPVDTCIKLPDGISFEQAAGFQIAYGTSHLALSHRAGLQAGETLVVLGAAGGVGLTAVEIGSSMGARVIAVARGRERLRTVRDAGANEVIDSDECPDLKTYLRGLGGVDVVYDPVGGAPGEAAFAALRRGGRFLLIGFASGKPPLLRLNHALVKNITIHGLYWGGYASLDPVAMKNSMKQLFTMFDAGHLNPVLGHVLPLDQLAEGYQMLRDRQATGKIIITL